MMPHSDPSANIHSMDEFKAMDRSVEVLIVDSNACNGPSFTHLDVSSFKGLRVFKVGDNSFAYVEELNLVELEKLERVVIGVNCFSKENSLGHFSLKNCRQVKELKMGRYSFRGYSACEIENNDSLEMIEMGELDEQISNSYWGDSTLKSCNFYGGDCRLRGYCDAVK